MTQYVTAERMIKIIKAHKGPVEVPVNWKHDVRHVVVQKADLIKQLEQSGTNPFDVLKVERVVVNGTAQNLMTLDLHTCI